MDPATLIAQPPFATAEFVVVVLAVGVVVELVKRTIEMYAPGARRYRSYRLFLAVLPIAGGAALAQSIIPDGPIDQSILGVIAGSFAASGYDAVKPAFKGAADGPPPRV